MFYYKLVYTVASESVDTLCIDSESTSSCPGRQWNLESGRYISSRVGLGSLRARGFLSLEEHEMHNDALTQLELEQTRGYQRNRSLPIEHSSARSYFRKLRMMQDQRSTHLWEYAAEIVCRGANLKYTK